MTATTLEFPNLDRPVDEADGLPHAAIASWLADAVILDQAAPVAPEPSPRVSIGRFRYSPSAAMAKRSFDTVVAVILLILLAPALAVIAAVVRATSPGPALFKQERVGFGEQRFTILKFRTMAAANDNSEHREFVQAMLRGDIPNPDQAPDENQAFKLVDDPRVTGIGAWLRRSSLDELPQLINVVRGEMSLVGPRPCLDYEVSEYSPRQRLRATCRPGMTGLWQVEGRSDLHMRDALELDLRYVETCSFGSDLTILARTAGVVARRSGV